MTSTPNSEQFADPNSRYAVESLKPPADVRALDSASQNDYEFSSAEDDNEPHVKAERYVQKLIDEATNRLDAKWPQPYKTAVKLCPFFSGINTNSISLCLSFAH